MSTAHWSSTLVALSVCLAAAHAQELGPAPARVKPAHYRVPPGWETRVITVKFRDGLLVRLRDGALSDLGTGALRGAEPTLARFASATWSRSHSLPEEKLDQLRATAEHNLGFALHDLNLQFRLSLPEGVEAEDAIDALNALEQVEMAESVPRPMALPYLDDFRGQQRYFAPAPEGTGVVAASQLPIGPGPAIWAAAGGHVAVADIEYSFDALHTDLPSIAQVGITGADPFNDDRHGTAVLGELFAIDGATGTTGGCHASPPSFAYAAVWDPLISNYVPRIESAISDCTNAVGAGGVILIEQQVAGPHYTGVPAISQLGLVPSEWYQPVWDAIRIAVGNQVTVVEAAGNGNENLDSSAYATGHHPFQPGAASDSGAIIVGASVAPGGPGVDRSRLSVPSSYWGSNYGSAVDLQGWGEKVTTLGYGDLYSATGVHETYTSNFGGTSSASPIVAATCAVVQSSHIDMLLNPLSPTELRKLLVNTGSPQQSGAQPASEHIGPRPDAMKALLALHNYPCMTKARGFDNSWSGFGPGGGILAMATFDDDGAGPNPPALFIGGDFWSAGGVACYGIAKWTGSGWAKVGLAPTLTGASPVIHALIVHDPDGAGPQPAALYAGGEFDTIGGVAARCIAKWDGTNWSALGNGTCFGLGVFALSSYDEDGAGPLAPSLVAGGRFATIGGINASCVARWRSGAWSAMGGGFNNTVDALEAFDPDNGGPQPQRLVAGGEFTTDGIGAATTLRSLAEWNGSSWSEMGGGNDPVYGYVFCLKAVTWGAPGTPLQILFVGGDFNWVGNRPAQGFVERLTDGGSGTTWFVPTNVPFQRPVFAIGAFQDGANQHPDLSDIYVGALDPSGWPLALYRVDPQNWTWWSTVDLGVEARAFQVFDEDGAGSEPPHLFVGGGASSVSSGSSSVLKLLGCMRPATPYCTAKTTSLGCVPTVDAIGIASASLPGGFSVSASNLLNQKTGLLFYGFGGRKSAPYQGGTMCVQAPLRRTTLLNSGGSQGFDDCSGVFSIDMNAFAAGALGGNPDPALREIGTTVDCQFWGRDPGFAPPNNTMLTSALEYLIGY